MHRVDGEIYNKTKMLYVIIKTQISNHRKFR